MTIGNDNTINGWLKGINYPTLNPADDPGGDDNTTFASDAFGMVLGYHSNDFNRTGSKYNPATASLVSSQTTGLTDLYNGNISSWTLQGDTISGNYAGQMGFKYRYDQLNRLKKEDYNSYAGSSWATTTDYDSRYTYDANGNLDTLIRNGYAGVNTNMDNFKYRYISATNKLEYVDDAVASGNYSTDIDDQSANNYQYDAIGNMAKDVQAGIDTILWNVYGKVKTVKKSNGDSLNFVYDAAGNRVQKIDKPYSGTTTTTYYVRDASGNVMSIYERAYNGNDYDYRQKEVPLYGSDRIGAYKPNKLIRTENTFCFTCEIYHSSTDLGHVNGLYARAIDKKEYEMKDHLSNIRATVGDRKWSDGTADIKSYINYYAFGSELVGKTYNSTSSRLGFNGQEKDDELKGSGNSYDYGARMLDVRTGRWLRPDPFGNKFPDYSPYNFSENNPIWKVDKGGDSTIYYSQSGQFLSASADKLNNAVVIIPDANLVAFKINKEAIHEHGVDNYGPSNQRLRKLGTSYLIPDYNQFYKENTQPGTRGEGNETGIFLYDIDGELKIRGTPIIGDGGITIFPEDPLAATDLHLHPLEGKSDQYGRTGQRGPSPAPYDLNPTKFNNSNYYKVIVAEKSIYLYNIKGREFSLITINKDSFKEANKSNSDKVFDPEKGERTGDGAPKGAEPMFR